MRTGEATGLQIAFLIFAILLLAVPLSDYVSRKLASTPDAVASINGSLQFLLAAIVILGFPKLRAFTRTELSKPIPPKRHAEVVVVGLVKVLVLFGVVGAMVLWDWAFGGGDLISYDMKSDPIELSREKALSMHGLFQGLMLAAIVAPVFEEIVFRGFLYRAVERSWGSLAATLLSSAVFACYHPHFFAAFTSGIIFVCLVRRTGTLWASISVHSFSNLMLWYPITGPIMFPGGDKPPGELSAWSLHLACLAFTAFALPLYISLAVRKPYVVPA